MLLFLYNRTIINALGPRRVPKLAAQYPASTRTQRVLCLGYMDRALRFPAKNKPQQSGCATPTSAAPLPTRSLTFRNERVHSFRPGAPALAHEVLETRDPTIQSSHCCCCAFTHRHHRCAGMPLTSSLALPRVLGSPACVGTRRGPEGCARSYRNSHLLLSIRINTIALVDQNASTRIILKTLRGVA